MENNDFNIEAAFKRLEEINRELSSNAIELQKSMKLYKEGTELALKCKEHLEGVEQELEIINKGAQ